MQVREVAVLRYLMTRLDGDGSFTRVSGCFGLGREQFNGVYLTVHVCPHMKLLLRLLVHEIRNLDRGSLNWPICG